MPVRVRPPHWHRPRQVGSRASLSSLTHLHVELQVDGDDTVTYYYGPRVAGSSESEPPGLPESPRAGLSVGSDDH